MTGDVHQRATRYIRAHFAGRLARRHETAMRAHLADCSDCHAYYDRYMHWSAIDPRAISPRERLARGAGLAGSSSVCGQMAVTATLLALVGAGIAIDQTHNRSEFAARGNSEGQMARLLIYEISSPSVPRLVEGEIASTAELAFAFETPSEATHLAIFAVDEAGQVYWYHPAWSDPATNPSTLAIVQPADGIIELHEAIRHPLREGELRIFALFLHEPRTVGDLEKALPKDAYRRNTLAIDAVAQTSRILRVSATSSTQR